VRGGSRDERLREGVDKALRHLAARQHGVFSRAQAVASGADRNTIYRRTAAAHWERLHPHVFRVPGSSRTWSQRALAACLCWGEGAVASHSSAFALWEMPSATRGTPELSVPRGRQRHHRCDAVVHHISLPPADITVVSSIPVTTCARTLIDVAAILPPNLVEEALDDALRRKLTSIPRLRWRIEALSQQGRQGIGMIRSLVSERDGGAVPESVFETRLLRVLNRDGLRVVPQYPVHDGDRVIAVVDFAFPDEKVATEAEGYKWHSGRARWESDLSRRNALTALGWRVIHVTWSDLKNEKALLARIRGLLGG